MGESRQVFLKNCGFSMVFSNFCGDKSIRGTCKGVQSIERIEFYLELMFAELESVVVRIVRGFTVESCVFFVFLGRKMGFSRGRKVRFLMASSAIDRALQAGLGTRKI